jgi:hypothetical protein
MKRGNTAAASTYVGPLGELLVDTGLRTIRVQDGATPGGMSTLATNVQIQTLTASIANIVDSLFGKILIFIIIFYLFMHSNFISLQFCLFIYSK